MEMVLGMLMWYIPALGSTPTTPDNGTLAGLLQSATQVLTWFITSMGSVLDFVLENPAVLMLFLILLVGAAVGMLFRVWHSA